MAISFPSWLVTFDLVISGGAADVAFACFGIQYIARSAAAQEGDIGRKREANVPWELAAAASARSARVKMAPPCVRPPALRCSAVITRRALLYPSFISISSTPAFVAKRSFLKKLLCGHGE